MPGLATARPAEAQFQTGFNVPPCSRTWNRRIWLLATDHMAGAGASFVRVVVIWADIASKATDRRGSPSTRAGTDSLVALYRRLLWARPALPACSRCSPWNVPRPGPRAPESPPTARLGNWKPSAAGAR